jgi:vacuolar-type H+-ATPase catalytic subunit A/Vma1
MRGIVNDAIAVYFRDATMDAAFAARWCVRWALA